MKHYNVSLLFVGACNPSPSIWCCKNEGTKMSYASLISITAMIIIVLVQSREAVINSL